MLGMSLIRLLDFCSFFTSFAVTELTSFSSLIHFGMNRSHRVNTDIVKDLQSK